MAIKNLDGLPTKEVAGVVVLDTPMIQAAQRYARVHSSDMAYNHVMRSWLHSVVISRKLEKDVGSVDPEVQAISAIFHDLGWDPTGELISKDKRFEVDGAIAARNWIQDQQAKGTVQGWDHDRIQLVWDAIALHTTPNIAMYKEPEVATVNAGIMSDFHGPDSDWTGTLRWDEFNRIKAEFPRYNVAQEVKEIICGFARTKPETTYDNWMMQYGLKYVDGYSTNGKLAINIVETALP